MGAAEKSSMREALTKMAAEAGKAGFSVSDVLDRGYNRYRVNSSIERMVNAGLLHKGKLGHRTMRLFGSVAWANEFENRRRVAPPIASSHSRMKANWDPDQEAVYPVDEDGNPLYKVTSVGLSDEALRQGQIRNVARWNSDAMSPRGASL